MNKELQDKLDEFIKDFLDQSEVKQYFLLKKELETSKEFKKLNNEVVKTQKEMSLSLGTSKYEENKSKYLKAKEQYDNFPAFVNFKVAQEEVSYLLNELERRIKN